MVKLQVFKKKNSTAEGRVFYSYITQFNMNDGEVWANIKFVDCEEPKVFPCVISVDKTCANIGKRNGYYTLFIREGYRVLDEEVVNKLNEEFFACNSEE